MQSSYRIRPMLPSDVTGVLDVQALAYTHILLEDADFFLNRLALAPDHCWVAASDTAHVGAYLIAYPWVDGVPPALNVAVARLPAVCTSWFLHDCAVHPEAQGTGLGGRLLRTAAARAGADGFAHASLVSLESAVPYWLRHGYTPASQLSPDLTAKLVGYGAGARYMTRALEAARTAP
nr:GNAT family N-acetyltransferase [Achromobacter aestuarii]